MALKIKKYNNITWLNIIEPLPEDVAYLKANYNFHPLDIKDLGHASQRSKIDIYPTYAFIIFRFPVTYKDSNLIGSHELDIFLGKDFLITIQKKKIKILNQFFYRVANNKKLQNELCSDRAALLLYHVLYELYSGSFLITDWLGKEINRTEELVYREDTKLAVRQLADLSRNLLTFKSIIDPQRYVIKSLINLHKDYLSSDLDNYFDDIADSIEKIYGILSSNKEMIDSLRVTNESLTSYRLNRVMRILTIFSVSLLPLTLFTGLYGMNLSTLPLIHDESLVWWIFGGLAIIIIAIFIWLKKKDII